VNSIIPGAGAVERKPSIARGAAHPIDLERRLGYHHVSMKTRDSVYPSRIGLGASALAVAIVGVAASATDFENLGVPVTKAMLMATAVGPDATGQKDLLYFDFAQTGATLFLVAVDPDTGEAHQYKAPVGPGAWALIRGPDEKMYLGTWESGYILQFDPKQADKGLQVIGKPSETETYIWQFAIGPDGKLYGCTYGQARLVSYDPKTGAMEDLGRMDDTQMYTRSVACGPSGKIYTAVGYGRANVVAYDPASRKHKSILPEKYASEKAASVHKGADGQVYVQCGSQAFRADDEALVPIDAGQVVGPPGLTLRDGRAVTVGELTADTCSFTVADPKTGAKKALSFRYQGDGAIMFVVGMGPDQKIYGSTAMPLEMFVHDPATRKSVHLGNPTAVNGEIYSLVPWHERLYVCAYPGSYLSVYDPKKPFQFGTKPGDNPRGFGPIGDGHLRPRAMIVGPGERLYIGSLPPYGELGGAMAVFDPAAERVIENYRNLIPNQSVVSLAYEPKSGLVFGGSSITGGGGSSPSEKEALFFAFDPQKKCTVFQAALEPGLGSYNAMAVADGKVFVSAGSKLIVVDPSTMKVAQTIALPGAPLEISLGLHRDGLLYGLTSRGVFAVDPRSAKVVLNADSPVSIRCGFALTDDAIYFGSGPQLWRYLVHAP
jgi:streptogramin lyase